MHTVPEKGPYSSQLLSMIGDHEYERSLYLEDYHDHLHHRHRRGYLRDSDEDTEDASETESMRPGDEERVASRYRPADEMKEQCFRSRLAELHQQLAQLEAGTHPAWVKGCERLQKDYEEQKFALNVSFELQMKQINKEFETEKAAAISEFEERRAEIKESLQSELDEQRRRFLEADSNDLMLDAVEPKPVIRRQLRRRPNDPAPMPTDRRRRPSPAHINYLLDDEQIADDLKLMDKILKEAKSAAREESRKIKIKSEHREETRKIKGDHHRGGEHHSHKGGGGGGGHLSADKVKQEHCVFEARIEDGKLFYNKKWYHRGQNIMLEATADGAKYPGIIHQIGNSDLTIRKTSETTLKQSNTKVTVNDLKINKYSIHRRS